MTAVALGAEIPLRRQRRSVSQLTSYSTCGEAYRLDRVERAPSRPAAWFHMGSAGGVAIEAWENSGRKMKPLDLKDLYFTEYDRLVAADMERVGESNFAVWMTGGFKKGADDINDRRELGWWQVQDYQSFALRESSLWAIVESEFKLEGEIAGVKILGYADQIAIDLTNGNLPFVRDLKSGKGVPDEPVQLAVYDYLLRQQVGTTTAGFADFIHLGRPASGRSKEKATLEVRHQMEDWPIERLERWVYDMDQAEKAGIFLPSTAKDCARTCGVSQWCRTKGSDLASVQQYLPTMHESTEEKHDD